MSRNAGRGLGRPRRVPGRVVPDGLGTRPAAGRADHAPKGTDL